MSIKFAEFYSKKIKYLGGGFMSRQSSKMKGYNNVFAVRLRSLVEGKITQEELAANIGCSRQAVSQYLDGKSLPNADKILLISKYLGVSSDYLLGLSNSKSPKLEHKAINEYLGINDYSIKTLHIERETPLIELIDYLLSADGMSKADTLSSTVKEIKNLLSEAIVFQRQMVDLNERTETSNLTNETINEFLYTRDRYGSLEDKIDLISYNN